MRRYKLDNEKARKLTDEEILEHKDFKVVMANYQKATRPLYRTPLYRNPRAFLAVLFVLMVLWMLWIAAEEELNPPPPAPTEQVVD